MTITRTNNYLKLEGGQFHNEQTFSFDDRVKSSALSALKAAQHARGRSQANITVFSAVRHGKMRNVREIGQPVGESLRSVPTGPVGVSQTNLIGLPITRKPAVGAV